MKQLIGILLAFLLIIPAYAELNLEGFSVDELITLMEAYRTKQGDTAHLSTPERDEAINQIRETIHEAYVKPTSDIRNASDCTLDHPLHIGEKVQFQDGNTTIYLYPQASYFDTDAAKNIFISDPISDAQASNRKQCFLIQFICSSTPSIDTNFISIGSDNFTLFDEMGTKLQFNIDLSVFGDINPFLITEYYSLPGGTRTISYMDVAVRSYPYILFQYKDVSFWIDSAPDLSNNKPTSPVSQPKSTKNTAEKPKEYSDGGYRVGKDIPAGEYKITPTSTQANYVVYNDSSQEDVLNYSYFSQGQRYVIVHEGNYIELSGCTMELAN